MAAPLASRRSLDQKHASLTSACPLRSSTTGQRAVYGLFSSAEKSVTIIVVDPGNNEVPATVARQLWREVYKQRLAILRQANEADDLEHFLPAEELKIGLRVVKTDELARKAVNVALQDYASGFHGPTFVIVQTSEREARITDSM